MVPHGGEDPVTGKALNDADLKTHLDGKSADELIEELRALYMEEKGTGKEFDPRIAEAYVEALGYARAPNPSAERAFERSWALFQTKHQTIKSHRKRRSVKVRWRIEAAVILVALLCVSAAAFNWKTQIIEWKDEIFGTVPASSGTMEFSEPDTAGYLSLKEAVQERTDLPMVPNWIPAGYVIDEIYQLQSEKANTLSALYQNGDNSVFIRIFQYEYPEDIPDLWVEKDRSKNRDIYVSHGIEHAISENYGRIQVIWENGCYVGNITGDISKADAKKMIDSIYENGG